MPHVQDSADQLFQLAVQCEMMAVGAPRGERRDGLVAQAAQYRADAEQFKMRPAFSWTQRS
jgi:hypothetical protein